MWTQFAGGLLLKMLEYLKLCETLLNSSACRKFQNVDQSIQSNFHELLNYIS